VFELTIDKALVLSRAQTVAKASRSPRADYDSAGVLQITAKEDNSITLRTGNGYLKVSQDVAQEDKVNVSSAGTCSVDANLFVKVLSAIPEDGNLVSMSCNDSKLLISSKVGKRTVKNWIPLIASSEIEFNPIKGKNVQSFKFSIDSFSKSIKAVAQWHGTDDYEPEYQQILVDFLKEETRFVCGCGSRFAIVSCKNDLNSDKFNDSTDSMSFVFPFDQALILQDLLGQQASFSSPIVMSAVAGKYEFKTSFGMSVLLEGVADIKYVPYMQQSQRMGERSGFVTVDGKDIQRVSKLMDSVIDTEYEKQNNVISANMLINNESIEFKSEFTRGLDCVIPVLSFDYSGGAEFSDRYSMRFLRDLSNFGNAETYEFSFFKPQDAIFCKPINGNPDYEYLMFFSALS